MANSEYNYIPTYIRRTINNRPKDVVTARYWNELFNLLIAQGDHTAEELGNILNHFSTRLIGVESKIAESAEAIANIRGVLRINVTSSNGVYSADKTFDEIKAAYDAGQLPYVVDDALSGFYDIYTLSHFWYDESSAQGFVDFERYLILGDTLKTDTLRIHSRALASGSNIEQRISAFNIPSGATYVKVNSTGDVISTVNGETYADIQALINAGKLVVVRYDDTLDFYYFETFRFSDSSGTHKRLNFRCDMGSIVHTLTLRDDNTWAFSETSLQPSSITDTGGYFTSDTVDGALQEIGAYLSADTPYIYKTSISESLAAGAIYFVTEEKVSPIQAALLDNRPVIICADSTADNKRVYYVLSHCNAVPTESSVANIKLYFASLKGAYEATITIENNSGSLQFTRSI